MLNRINELGQIGRDEEGVHYSPDMMGSLVYAEGLTADLRNPNEQKLIEEEMALYKYLKELSENDGYHMSYSYDFVPSVDGISHNPKEFTPGNDLVAGANVLLDVVAKLTKSK